MAIGLGNIASVLDSQGDHAGAAGLFQQALALSRDIGDRKQEATDLNNLGSVRLDQDNPVAARDAFAQA